MVLPALQRRAPRPVAAPAGAEGCPVAALRDLRVDSDLGFLSIHKIDASSARALIVFNDVQLPEESLQQDPQSASAMRVKRSVDCFLSTPDSTTGTPFRSKIRASWTCFCSELDPPSTPWRSSPSCHQPIGPTAQQPNNSKSQRPTQQPNSKKQQQPNNPVAQ